MFAEERGKFVIPRFSKRHLARSTAEHGHHLTLLYELKILPELGFYERPNFFSI